MISSASGEDVGDGSFNVDGTRDVCVSVRARSAIEVLSMCASAHGSKTFNGAPLPHRLFFKNPNSEDSILFIR
jgi:hypothetical protein